MLLPIIALIRNTPCVNYNCSLIAVLFFCFQRVYVSFGKYICGVKRKAKILIVLFLPIILPLTTFGDVLDINLKDLNVSGLFGSTTLAFASLFTTISQSFIFAIPLLVVLNF